MQLNRKRTAYNPHQFVGRDAEQAHLHAWVQGDKQLLTITGPPGIGKTWFINNSFRQLKAASQNSYIIELPIADPHSDQNGLPPELLQSWADQLLIELNQDCPLAYDFELGQELSSLLEQVAHDICHRCWPGRPLFFFIDGGDLLSQAAWRLFERQVIESLARQLQIRFIITLKTSQPIKSFLLKRREQRLELGTLQGRELGLSQMQKLNPDLDLTRCEYALPDYSWDHPGLNMILAAHLQTDPETAAILLKPDLVATVLSELEALPGNAAETINLLACLARHESDTWSAETIGQLMNISLAQAWDWINLLNHHWFISNVGGPNYKITDGLRQFLRAAMGQKLIEPRCHQDVSL
jgi:AAA ATPase domain